MLWSMRLAALQYLLFAATVACSGEAMDGVDSDQQSASENPTDSVPDAGVAGAVGAASGDSVSQAGAAGSGGASQEPVEVTVGAGGSVATVDAGPMEPELPCDNPKTYYLDEDGDDFGAKGTGVLSCEDPVPQGWSLNEDDCYDQNPDAKPGLEAANRDTDRGDGSFDYNCDGKLQYGWRDFAQCDSDAGPIQEGWSDTNTLPGCGVIAPFISVGIGGACSEPGVKQQSCH